MKVLFKGTRVPLTSTDDNIVVFSVDGGNLWANVPLYLDEVNHSPTGFEWGYRGSGPAQLSYALLRVYFRVCHGDDTQDAARGLYMYFKDDIICGIQKPEWELDSSIIDGWLENRGLLSAFI